MKENFLKLIIYGFLIIFGYFIYTNNQKLNSGNVIIKDIVYEKYQSKEQFEKGLDKPVILAHRGSRYLLPENTILAFKTALDLGADVIETDVRSSSDGVLVVIHDNLVDRTTNGKGEVEKHTVAQLRDLDAGYNFSPDNSTTFPYRSKGIKIPLAKELFESLPAETQLNIEIKENSLDVAQLLWNQIENSFEKTNRKPRSVLISCRYCEPTQHIRKLAQQYQQKKGLPALPITTSACEQDATKFVILNQFFLARIYYTWYPITNFECFQVPTFSGPIRLDTHRFIDSAHYFGKQVHFWVVNFNDEIRNLLDLPIDGIISDRADRVVSVFKEKSLKPSSFQIPKPLPSNSTGTYFLPEFDIEENHTCISLTCILVQRIHQIILSLIFAFLFLKIMAFKNRNKQQ
ncbi:hypothetical protein DICPUDRAFT_91533 [Dictyostelium purpureum]|uniref:GP-PDE domain-containing protein n=1 Tax=Dictyostelium purpureum TaxID=5786 RepID=F0ZDU7_DICPU|nr:uncharacterized protein DICPUDRAFT_91533 [Dictyostelium purpureum]EGC37841.1 hypothetical protein DICPUDRAFT_91533 [Dictyostelium purpureum]|eukprot:XP_003285591.1 hypothetical protein DICPUDRAFT_91533 [Dictyostelium purpureum]